jgi:hypothetical protein
MAGSKGDSGASANGGMGLCSSRGSGTFALLNPVGPARISGRGAGLGSKNDSGLA